MTQYLYRSIHSFCIWGSFINARNVLGCYSFLITNNLLSFYWSEIGCFFFSDSLLSLKLAVWAAQQNQCIIFRFGFLNLLLNVHTITLTSLLVLTTIKLFLSWSACWFISSYKFTLLWKSDTYFQHYLWFQWNSDSTFLELPFSY